MTAEDRAERLRHRLLFPEERQAFIAIVAAEIREAEQAVVERLTPTALATIIARGVCRVCRQPSFKEHIKDQTTRPHNFDSDPSLVAEAILKLVIPEVTP